MSLKKGKLFRKLFASPMFFYLFFTEYVTNNNVKASIVSRNIRCTNGIIHIIDTLLFFPYETVAETMETHSELM